LKRAEATIGEARNDELISLVTFGKRYEVVNRFSTDRTRTLAALRSLTVGWEGTDYEQALRGAESLLADIHTSGAKRIILISDFQAPGWKQSTASFKLSNDIKFTTLDVSGNNAPANVAVTNVEARAVVFGQKYIDHLSAHLNNYSDAPTGQIQVDFQINDQTVDKRSVNLNAREEKVLEFTGFNLNDGANRCVVRISTSDFAP